MNKKIINIGEQSYKLLYDEFEDGIDIDNLLKIDYSNLIGEIITFPIIVNKFGLLLADAESKVAETKLNIDVYESKAKERLRLRLQEENGGKNPTVDALNSAVMQDKGYQALKKKLINDIKTRDYINSAFWAAKDKSDKISVLLKNSDITLDNAEIGNKINGVLIKKMKKQLIE